MKTIGRYKIVRRLAVGGMAETWLAQTELPGQHLVLKVLLPQHRQDADLLRMLHDEAKLTLALQHPNLIQSWEYTTDPLPFIVLEYVDGPTLRALLAHCGGSLPPELAAHIIYRVADALSYVHDFRDDAGNRMNIVHRDVTPDNVMITRAGEVKLGDFGIARSAAQAERTRTGVVKGTLRYMAPEQLAGEELDLRADVYSLGLMFFELLTGEPYLTEKNEALLVDLVRKPPQRKPSAAGGPAAFDEVVLRATRRFPEERYRDAGAFLKALQVAAAGAGLDGVGSDVLDQRLAQTLPQAAPLQSVATLSGNDRVPAAPPAEPPAALRGKASRYVAPLLVVAVLGGAAYVLSKRLPNATKAPSVSTPDSRPVATPKVSDIGIADARGPDVRHADAIQADAPPTDTRANEDARPVAVAPSKGKPVRKRPQRPQRAKRPSRKLLKQRSRLAKRLRRASGQLSARGISRSDIDPALATRLRQTSGAIAKADTDDLEKLEQAIAALERALAALRPDKAMLKRKLARADRALRAAAATGKDVSKLKRSAADALAAVAEGHYARANTILNRLLRALR